jgi:hypothetical protein
MKVEYYRTHGGCSKLDRIAVTFEKQDAKSLPSNLAGKIKNKKTFYFFFTF